MRHAVLFPALFAISMTACAAQKEQNTETTTPAQPNTTASNMPRVALTTNMGDIVIELNSEKAPLSSANFIEYVNSGHYDGTIFHRVIDNFMIQGGGFDQNMQQRPTRASIQNEADNGLKNNRGTIAMARTSAPHSGSSQFFINVQNNDFLNHTQPTPQGWGYAVFGQVVQGMDVVDKIKTVQTSTISGHQNVPTQPIVIEKAVLLK
ncbi:MAG: peptidylprolyl isomerase [Pseudomonadota bacterium]|nr:peptidylprolyl isomerase [Pseudomonadota bacterium]